jgi:hypothetical protein
VSAPIVATTPIAIGAIENRKLEPADHVDAGGHHRGRVDERADRRGTGHRVGQPDVERDLRALAGRAAEEQQTDAVTVAPPIPPTSSGCAASSVPQLGEVDRLVLAQAPEEPEEPDDEEEVTDAVRDERLLARLGELDVLEPEADQQVAAEPDAFPPDEHQEEVVAEHEQEHREDEQVQVREVPPHARPIGFVVHVANRVDVDEEADAGDHVDHHRGESVREEADVGVQLARADPRVERLAERLLGVVPHVPEHRDRHEPRQEDRAAGDPARDQALGRPARDDPQQRNREGAEQRKQRNERQHRLSLEQVQVLEVDADLVPEEEDHEREPDRGFGGGDRHHEHGEDLSVDLAVLSCEPDEREVHAVQHELDRHEHDQDVLARQHARDAREEQERREHEHAAETHTFHHRSAESDVPLPEDHGADHGDREQRRSDLEREQVRAAEHHLADLRDGPNSGGRASSGVSCRRARRNDEPRADQADDREPEDRASAPAGEGRSGPTSGC